MYPHTLRLFAVCRSWLVLLGLTSTLFGQTFRAVPGEASINPQREQLKRDADAAYREGDYERTISLTDEVLSANANDDVALYLRASARVELGIARSDRALLRDGIQDAREALQKQSPQKSDYYLPYLYGMTHLSRVEQKPSHAETGRQVASQLLERSGLTPPERANVLYQRGLAALQLEDFDAAAEDLQQAVSLQSDHLAAHLSLTEALSRAGQSDAAEQAINAAVTRFPEMPVVLNHRGVYLQSQGRTNEAVRDFTAALEMNDKYLEPYLNRGYALLEADDPEAAIGDLSRVIERQPDNIPALSMHGAACLALGQASDAVVDFRRVLELGPPQPGTCADLGLALLFSGNPAEASQHLYRAREIQPSMRFLQPWQCAALKMNGDHAAAEQTAAEARARPTEQRDWFDALTLAILGEVDEAELLSLVDGEDGARREAQLCEANYFLGLRRKIAGDPEADSYFRRAVESPAKRISARRGAQYALGEFADDENSP